jgi:RNA polymerase sigma factor (sigma-70 family)
MQPAEQNAVFDRWMTKHSGILHHVARGFAAGADAHDLMQELMLAVWRAIPVYRTEAKVSTFVYRVAHHAALTWKRTQKNYRGRVERFEAQATAIERDADAKSARERETLDWLYAQIRALAPLDRSLILLHLDNVSYAEIAELHGLSESNVGARLTRLKQKLSDAMKEVSDELR